MTTIDDLSPRARDLIVEIEFLLKQGIGEYSDLRYEAGD